MIHNYRFSHAMVKKQARGIRKNNLNIFCYCPGLILASRIGCELDLGLFWVLSPKAFATKELVYIFII